MLVVLYGVRSGAVTVRAVGDEYRCDLLTFLKEQQTRAPGELAKLMRLLDYAAAYGPPNNEQKSRALGNGLFEFKADSLRVIWFWDSRQLILCSHGFVKKRQKTPQAQIEKARSVRQSYEAAKRSRTLRVKG